MWASGAAVPVMAQLVVIGRWTATAITHYYPVHPPSLYPLIMILYTKPLPTKEVHLSKCTSSWLYRRGPYIIMLQWIPCTGLHECMGSMKAIKLGVRTRVTVIELLYQVEVKQHPVCCCRLRAVGAGYYRLELEESRLAYLSRAVSRLCSLADLS